MTEHHAKMHKDEVSVSDAMVRLLLSSHFPQWSEKSLERLPDSGTDSAIYRLGDDSGHSLAPYSLGSCPGRHRSSTG